MESLDALVHETFQLNRLWELQEPLGRLCIDKCADCRIDDKSFATFVGAHALFKDELLGKERELFTKANSLKTNGEISRKQKDVQATMPAKKKGAAALLKSLKSGELTKIVDDMEANSVPAPELQRLKVELDEAVQRADAETARAVEEAKVRERAAEEAQLARAGMKRLEDECATLSERFEKDFRLELNEIMIQRDSSQVKLKAAIEDLTQARSSMVQLEDRLRAAETDKLHQAVDFERSQLELRKEVSQAKHAIQVVEIQNRELVEASADLRKALSDAAAEIATLTEGGKQCTEQGESAHGLSRSVLETTEPLKAELEAAHQQVEVLTMENRTLRKSHQVEIEEITKLMDGKVKAASADMCRRKGDSLTEEWNRRKLQESRQSTSGTESQVTNQVVLKSKIGQLQQEYNTLNQRLFEIQNTRVRRNYSAGSPATRSHSSPSSSSNSVAKLTPQKTYLMQSSPPKAKVSISSPLRVPSPLRASQSGFSSAGVVHDRPVGFSPHGHSQLTACGTASAYTSPSHSVVPLVLREQSASPLTSPRSNLRLIVSGQSGAKSAPCGMPNQHRFDAPAIF